MVRELLWGGLRGREALGWLGSLEREKVGGGGGERGGRWWAKEGRGRSVTRLSFDFEIELPQ